AIRSTWGAIPSALRSILARCLAPDPADRYQRASELAEDLDRWRLNQPLVYAREPWARRGLVRWASRQRTALMVAAACLAGGVVATWGVWRGAQESLRSKALAKLSVHWDTPESGSLRYHDLGHWRPDEQGDIGEIAQRHLMRYGLLGGGDWRRRDDVRSLPA